MPITKLRTDDIVRVLRANPRSGSAELCVKLGGINRSTLTRGLKAVAGDLVCLGGSRRTRYALRRSVRGSRAPIPLFRIDETGHGHEVGRLEPLHPEGSALVFSEPFGWPLVDDMRDGWFDGLPYPVVDMRPQGFLGRNFARNHAPGLSVSENPEEWSDDDVIHVLSMLGHDLPGNLVLGEIAYRRFLENVRLGRGPFLSDADIETTYPHLAASAMAHGDVGSSAAGEFPKFTTGRILDGGKAHVIVKFSGADTSAAVRRWSDLLICEHMALATLETVLRVAVTRSRIHFAAGRTFLEVMRFDRHGEFGRSAVCTLASLNAALLGMAAPPWNKVAAAMREKGLLSGQDAATIDLVWWFGKLIANTDMHAGNLAFRPGLALAPVYDMLPMLYAPMRGGEVPDRIFSPDLPMPSERGVWMRAADAAERFWESCAMDSRISPAFRETCRSNARRLREMIAMAA